jgi:hypothetical protein
MAYALATFIAARLNYLVDTVSLRVSTSNLTHRLS